MNIAKDAVVAINYTLRNDAGEVVDTSAGRDPLYYLQGHQNIIIGLEEKMEGKKVGDSLMVSVAPEKGYGVHDPAMVQEVPRERFQGVENIEAGMQFQAQGPDGGAQVVTVTGVTDTVVMVDANHPLAGQNLHFEVEVVEVREATSDELSHGHVHGPGGVEH
ncbi:MAG: peptidylprolyl isomerase [Bacteroidia bacterium]